MNEKMKPHPPTNGQRHSRIWQQEHRTEKKRKVFFSRRRPNKVGVYETGDCCVSARAPIASNSHSAINLSPPYYLIFKYCIIIPSLKSHFKLRVFFELATVPESSARKHVSCVYSISALSYVLRPSPKFV